MIYIHTPFIVEKGNEAILKAKIEISNDTALNYIDLQQSYKHVHWRVNDNYPPVEWDGDEAGLWFSVPIEYKNGLCSDRGDAFVVAMIWYAMATGSDIQSEAPVSPNILMGINELLIPALLKSSKGFSYRIRLHANPTTTICHNIGAVGTGMSCGIDSLYTLKKYTSTLVPDKYKLTHLAYFNMGAIFHPNRSKKTEYTLEQFYKETDRMSLEKVENAKQVAKTVDMPLVYIQSNIDKDYYRGAYGDTAVYRNCACVLALQNLFSVYYCSSAGWPDFFDLNIREGSEHYESLLCNVFSTDTLQFILSDYDTRFEKTASLVDYDIAHDFLDVCFCFNSCGKCAKCYRTMITLDVLGKLHLFNKVFNIDEFKKNIDDAYFWLLKTKDGNPKDDNVVFAVEIYNYIVSHNSTIPKGAYVKYRKWKLSKFYLFRLLKKIYRNVLK